MFSKAYDTFFPEIQKRIKTESFLSPWITEDIQISKRKQELYKKKELFLKKLTYASEKIINIVKILLKNWGTFQIGYIAKWIFEIWEWGKTHLEYKLKSNQQKESQISFSQ